MSENVLEFMREPLPQDLQVLVKSGRYSEAKSLILELLRGAGSPLRERLLFELDRMERLRHEFPYSLEEAYAIASAEVRELSMDEFRSLLGRGCVDHVLVDGQVKVLRRFLPNMFWLCPELRKRRLRGEDEREVIAREVLRGRAERVVEAARARGGGYVLPLRYRVRARLRVLKPSEYPLRVWIPLPRQDELHPEVRILKASPEPKRVAPPDHPQRTVYFELEAGSEVELTYEYVSRGFHVQVDPKEVSGEVPGELEVYLAERPPHIVFTPALRELAERIVGGETNPYLKARKIWDWITSNVRYTYAMDYALYDNISEYVATHLRGDCGMQALLFITLCRIVGVPARWQSGWYMNPVSPGMHDWAQFYVEPYGWLYADPSFGGRRRGELWRPEFYFGSIEGYRLAANVEVSAQFDPPKKFFRSDPVDSQRGEVEAEDRNLYYDEWEFSLDILGVERLPE
ncbi:MAG: transglutaminase-like domain-containing protein [Thermofilum sp.]